MAVCTDDLALSHASKKSCARRHAVRDARLLPQGDSLDA